MTRDEAKALGATHYRYNILGFIVYINTCTDGQYYWSRITNKWMKNYSNYTDLKPL